ncbi:MAG: HAMP domain-containing sensor histidine kinase, partial [Pirellulales bacterium]
WLSSDEAQRRSQLQALLAEDHGLGSWARACGEPASSLAELAAWLDSHGAAQLLPFFAGPRSEPPQSASHHRLHALLVMKQRLQQLEETFETTLQQEKLSAMVALAAGAGHEINNPLGSIAGRAQLLLRDEHDPERRRALAKINTQAFRAHEMIADMMLFAEPPAPKLAETNLAELVDRVLTEFAAQLEERGIEIVFSGEYEDCRTAPAVSVDATQIAVAVSALVRNAIESIGGGGVIDMALRLSHERLPAGRTRAWHTLIVRDNGPGVSADARRHLFDPFYSGREAGRGLGFGLSKCWRIVTAHNGQIEVDSQPGHGATFTISLPERTDEFQ